MIAALIVAAGRGTRMGGATPKQYRLLAGVPILRHTLGAFLDHPAIGLVQVVINEADRAFYEEAVSGLSLPSPVKGGATRQESVCRGLESLIELAPEKVLIHDAVRPFVDPQTISRVIERLHELPAAIAAVPVTDTLKRGSGGVITGTLDREGLWRAQTPQGFRFAAILAAHRDGLSLASARGEATDDATLAEEAGLAVGLVTASEENFKITTEADLERAERWLRTCSTEFFGFVARGGG